MRTIRRIHGIILVQQTKKTSYRYASASQGWSVQAAIEFCRRWRDDDRARSIQSHLYFRGRLLCVMMHDIPILKNMPRYYNQRYQYRNFFESGMGSRTACSRPRPRPVIMIVEKNDISHQNPIVKLTTKRLLKHKLSTKLSLSLHHTA